MSVQPEVFCLEIVPFPVLVPNYGCLPPRGRSCALGPFWEGGLAPCSLWGLKDRILLDSVLPVTPHPGAATAQGDDQQSPWAQGHPVAAAGDRPPVPTGALPVSMGRGSPGTGGSRRQSQEEKRERERERQHMVKRSSDRLGSHSSSFSPHHRAGGTAGAALGQDAGQELLARRGTGRGNQQLPSLRDLCGGGGHRGPWPRSWAGCRTPGL